MSDGPEKKSGFGDDVIKKKLGILNVVGNFIRDVASTWRGMIALGMIGMSSIAYGLSYASIGLIYFGSYLLVLVPSILYSLQVGVDQSKKRQQRTDFPAGKEENYAAVLGPFDDEINLAQHISIPMPSTDTAPSEAGGMLPEAAVPLEETGAKRFGTIQLGPKNSKMLRNGDVVLCSGSGLLSRLIQSATGSIWSHVGFILRVNSIHRVMMVESVESKGVRTVPLEKYLKDYNGTGRGYPGGIVVIRHDDFAKKVPNPANLEKFAQIAVDRFGYNYNWLDILRIAARIILGKAGITDWRDKIGSTTRFICSEYVARCFHDVGINIKWNSKKFISPADFAADPNFKQVAILKIV